MNSQEHDLTDDEFAELLLRADSAVAANEADSEAAALRSAFRSYRAETLQWAERRSATQPSLQPAARRSRFWAGGAAMVAGSGRRYLDRGGRCARV